MAAGTATVTISKVGGYAVGDAQNLLNALGYKNTSQDPLGANRTVTLTSIKDIGGILLSLLAISPDDPNEIQAITGATISSEAVVSTINQHLYTLWEVVGHEIQ